MLLKEGQLLKCSFRHPLLDNNYYSTQQLNYEESCRKKIIIVERQIKSSILRKENYTLDEQFSRSAQQRDANCLELVHFASFCIQGNVYLMCLYLITLYNVNGCLLKLKLKLLNVQKGNHTNTIHANSPVYGTDLLPFPTGQHFSQIKSSFELFCVLV